MAELVRKMVRESLNSLVHLDVMKARMVLEADDLVDEEKHRITREVIQLIDEGVKQSKHAVYLLLVSRNLERIADLATNITEDVIFMVEGEIVRHK